MSGDRTRVHIDGGSRGNPGPSAYAVVIAPPGGSVVEEADTLGETTNNVAEYTALVRALERCEQLQLKNLLIHCDSELIVKQMNGQYQVKNADLKALYDDAQVLLKHFDKVTITHVRREQNKRADQLCNLALDGAPMPRGECSVLDSPPSEEPDFEEQCLQCLRDAQLSWQEGELLSAMRVWQDLWAILQREGVVKER